MRKTFYTSALSTITAAMMVIGFTPTFAEDQVVPEPPVELGDDFVPPKLSETQDKDKTIVLHATILFKDPDDHALCKPGENGTFEVLFGEDHDIHPTGTIRLRSMAPEYLEVDENNNWIAKKEGVVPVAYEWEYSKETMDALKEKYPGYAFVSTDTVEAFTVTVSNIISVFRLYNPNTGEHLFTTDRAERKELARLGWTPERISWNNREDQRLPIRRLYNPNAGDHHYTMDEREVDYLVKAGWKLDGTALYSESEKDIPVYRCYNPNAKAGSHHFTTDKKEYDSLVKLGWKAEGIAFYATSADRITTFDPTIPQGE